MCIIHFLNPSLSKLPTSSPPTSFPVLDLLAQSLPSKSSLTSRLFPPRDRRDPLNHIPQRTSSVPLWLPTAPRPGYLKQTVRVPGHLLSHPHLPIMPPARATSRSLNALPPALCTCCAFCWNVLPPSILPELTLPPMGRHLGLPGPALCCPLSTPCSPIIAPVEGHVS